MMEEKLILLEEDPDEKSVLDEDQLNLDKEVKKKKSEQEQHRFVLSKRPRPSITLDKPGNMTSCCFFVFLTDSCRIEFRGRTFQKATRSF